MVAALERHLAQQELERDDIETLIDHRSRFVAARVENPQEQGTRACVCGCGKVAWFLLCWDMCVCVHTCKYLYVSLDAGAVVRTVDSDDAITHSIRHSFLDWITGTVVSMKQLLKLRAKREQVLKRIEELYKLVLQVHARDHHNDSSNRTSNLPDDIDRDNRGKVNAHLEHVTGQEDGNDGVIAAPERNHTEYCCSPDNYLDKIQAILSAPPPLLTSNLLNDHQYLMEQAKKCRDIIPKRQQTPRAA